MANRTTLDKENMSANDTFSITAELEGYFGPLKDGVKLILPLQDVSNKQSSGLTSGIGKIHKKSCGRDVCNSKILGTKNVGKSPVKPLVVARNQNSRNRSPLLFVSEDEEGRVTLSDNESLSDLEVHNLRQPTTSFSQRESRSSNGIQRCSASIESTKHFQGSCNAKVGSEIIQRVSFTELLARRNEDKLLKFPLEKVNNVSNLREQSQKKLSEDTSKGLLKGPCVELSKVKSQLRSKLQNPELAQINKQKAINAIQKNKNTGAINKKFCDEKLNSSANPRVTLRELLGFKSNLKYQNSPLEKGNYVANFRDQSLVKYSGNSSKNIKSTRGPRITLNEFIALRSKSKAKLTQSQDSVVESTNRVLGSQELPLEDTLKGSMSVEVPESKNQNAKNLPKNKFNEIMRLFLTDDSIEARKLPFPVRNPPKETAPLQETSINDRKKSIDEFKEMMNIFLGDDPTLVKKLVFLPQLTAKSQMSGSEGPRNESNEYPLTPKMPLAPLLKTTKNTKTQLGDSLEVVAKMPALSRWPLEGPSSKLVLKNADFRKDEISKIPPQKICAKVDLALPNSEISRSLTHLITPGEESMTESSRLKWWAMDSKNESCFSKLEMFPVENSTFREVPLLNWSPIISQMYSPPTTQSSSKQFRENVMMVQEKPQFSQWSVGNDQNFYPTPSLSDSGFLKSFEVTTEMREIIFDHPFVIKKNKNPKRKVKVIASDSPIKKRRTRNKFPIIQQKHENILALLLEDNFGISVNNISKIGTANWLEWSLFLPTTPIKTFKPLKAMISTTWTKLNNQENQIKIFTKGEIKVYESPNSIEKVNEETYESLKQKLTQSQTVCSLAEEVAPKTEKEQIQWRIKDLIVKIFHAFEAGQIPVFLVRKKCDNNCVFQNDRFQMKSPTEATMAKINYNNMMGRKKFCLMLYALGKIYSLLETDKKLTKREIFYEIKHLIRTQARINKVIETISCLMNVGPWKFNIVSHKGLVYGNLKLTFASGEIMNCNVAGTMIPYDLDHVTKIESVADFILVVEKESIFHKLIQDLPNTMKQSFIMITGKGFPDLNTQVFLKKIWQFMGIPVLILADADPHGVRIMMTYRFGSVNNCHLSDELAIPEARWLGVFPSEILSLGIHHSAITNNERNMLKKLIDNPFTKNYPRIKEELRILLERNQKAAIEGLMKTSKFLCSSYLPSKHMNADYI